MARFFFGFWLALSLRKRYEADMSTSLELQKKQAALAAVALVQDGMVLGLGTGSTAAHFVDGLAARIQAEGLNITGVPTSKQTRAQAEKLGIPLAVEGDVPQMDLCVDGADEIGPNLSLVKGGGGALLREKIVAYHAKQLVVIADYTKLVAQLGAFPLPVEIIPFGWEATRRALMDVLAAQGLPQTVRVRHTTQGAVFKTDNGNMIVDVALGRIAHPETLAQALLPIPGVVEHGLFLGMAQQAFVAHPTHIEHIKM